MNQEAYDILESLPVSGGGYMYGHGEPPNAYVYRDGDGRLIILPIDGGLLGVVEAELFGDSAAFPD